VSDNERLADIYRNADLLVLPSHRHGVWEELFGIVLIEAMACETPVVATDCVGPSEIIEDGTNGFLIEQHDMGALQKVIEDIASRPSLSKRLGEQARRDVVNNYDISPVADQWDEMLNT
jgi:glycosyltransferase involved in cell wall biosynthesis